MTDTLALSLHDGIVASLGIGALLGLFFFGGLWWTVQRLQQVRHPGLLLMASFSLRASVTLCAFYMLMAGSWERLLASAAGFLLARVLFVRSRSPRSKLAPLARPFHSYDTDSYETGGQ